MQCCELSESDLIYCESCCHKYIKVMISKRENLETCMSVNKEYTRLSMTRPPSYKCQFQISRGNHRGWYCGSDSHKNFDFCLLHIKAINDRIWSFYTNDDILSLDSNTHRCKNLYNLQVK